MAAIRNLASILVRPRQTMRRILEQPRDRLVMPLLILAAISGVVTDLDSRGLRDALGTMRTPLVVLIVVAINLAVALFTVLMCYALAWVATQIGRRVFEGQGTTREVRSAMAWGLAPVIWALLYRIPLAFLLPGKGAERFRAGDTSVRLSGFDFSTMGLGCLVAVAEIAVLVWFLVIASNTLAEAHRFSTARGFATLLLTLAAPFVVMVAAVLAIAI